MNRRIIAIIVLGLVLLASLMACGYFGVKTIRRTRLRRAAMTAYEKKEYPLAERLLLQYVQKDPNAEAEYVALANIYHEFGNAGMEAQMWQTASSLDPLNPEYRENILTSAVKSASYPLLHGILGRMAKVDEAFTDAPDKLHAEKTACQQTCDKHKSQHGQSNDFSVHVCFVFLCFACLSRNPHGGLLQFHHLSSSFPVFPAEDSAENKNRQPVRGKVDGPSV